MRELFWCLWSLTALISAYSLVRAWRNPTRLIEWEFVFVFLCTYIYVYMALNVAQSLETFVDDRDLALGQLLPLLCLIGGIWGWRRGTKGVGLTTAKRGKPVATYTGSMPFWIGMGLMAVGIYGSFKTSVSVLRKSGQFTEDTSGYIYLLFYLGFAGMILCQLYLYTRKIRRFSFHWILFGACAVLFILPYFAHQQRGPLFAFATVVAFSYFLLKRKPPNAPLMFFGAFLLGFAMLFLLQVRLYTTNGYNWTAVFNVGAVYEALVGRSKRIYDNESLNNSQLIGAIYDGGKYNFGTGHLSLPLNAIPRQLWKQKPGIGQGIVNPKLEIYPRIQKKYRLTLLGYGASAGVVAYTFLEYGFLTPFFFFTVGYVTARIYRRFILRQSETCFIIYLSIIACSQWFILQQFSQFFVPFCFFAIPSILVLAFCRKMSPAPQPMARPLPKVIGYVRPSNPPPIF